MQKYFHMLQNINEQAKTSVLSHFLSLYIGFTSNLEYKNSPKSDIMEVKCNFIREL